MTAMPPEVRPRVIERTIEKILAFLGKDSALDRAIERQSMDPWASYSHQRSDVMLWVDKCLQQGITIRWLSNATGVSGSQLLGLVDDPRRRAAAHLAEIHHHERALEELNLERKRAVVAEFHEGGALSNIERRITGLQVTDIAARWGITRPTLYAWVREG